jgi:Holliday junction resolvase RusA-like endonuclease
MLETMGMDGWPGPSPDMVILACTLDLTPKAKERARVVTDETGRSRGYTPTATAEYQKALGWLVKGHVRGRRNDTDDLGVIVVFHVRGRQRRDVDNLLKALLDGCNGVAWRDDAQVVTVHSHVVRGESQPRIDLCIYVAKKVHELAAIARPTRATPEVDR